jgi:integrase
MLSDAKVKSLKIDDGKRHADRDGLVLEIRPSGKKVFLFRFQWEKKPQTITLGNYPSLSLADARMKPVTSNRHYKSLTCHIYPFIGDKPIDEVTKAELLKIIQPHEILGHHEVTHRLHDRLEAIFEFAVGASLTDNYPFIGLKKALAPKPRVTNQPAIHPNEAHKMLATIKNTPGRKTIKIYTELLAHLFTRPSELRLAQWSEFNLQQAEWHIPAERMKMAAAHWVPLSPRALELLKELRLVTGFTPYLFNSPSAKTPKPISETSARKLLHNNGYKDLHTLHGFRALASTVLHEQGHFRSDAIEAQLAHKVQGVRGVYLRADFKQERRLLMEWYSNWLLCDNKDQAKINKLTGKL